MSPPIAALCSQSEFRMRVKVKVKVELRVREGHWANHVERSDVPLFTLDCPKGGLDYDQTFWTKKKKIMINVIP